MGRLATFHKQTNETARNNLLFRWLCDDSERAQLYGELRREGFPVLQFKSLLRSANQTEWPDQDVYLLSKREHIEAALKNYSVKPYKELGSGGRFMLGIDDPDVHYKQNRAARIALKYSGEEIEKCIQEAYRRASVLPLKAKDNRFDLPTEIAEQTALRFVELLYGFRDEAHSLLARYMGGAYKALVFQIIGRHFVSDSGLPPVGSPDAVKLEKILKEQIRAVTNPSSVEELKQRGLKHETVIACLHKHYGDQNFEELAVVVLGLIAGTIGNVVAAVSIALSHFFTPVDKRARPLIDEAQESARSNQPRLEQLVWEALKCNPPAAFLARTSSGPLQEITNKDGKIEEIPEGAHVLLALGADADDALVFGGPYEPEFLHRCIGEHLARPLILYVVQQVLQLPGLAQAIDDEGNPKKLEKDWGVICRSYPLQFQRDRLMNQQPLHVVLKIKEPIEENARKLEVLTRGGAFIVQDALDKSHHVHFAWFMLVENRTHLAMMTVYDGDFDAYVEHFASGVALFDKQLEFLEGAPPTPVRDHPKEFVEWIRKHNQTPLGSFFYTAYPDVSVAQVLNLTAAGADR